MKYQWCFPTSVLLAWSLVTVNPARAQTWSQLAISGAGPTAIAFNTTNYDSKNNRLIVFVSEGGSVPSQVWVLTNTNGFGGTPAWTQLQPTGTPAMNNGGSTAIYAPTANQLIVYGGCTANCGSSLSTVHVVTNANGLGGTPVWTQSSPTSSIPRDYQSAVYDPKSNSMITFGGNLAYYGTDQNDTNVLSPANGSSPTWTTLAPSGALPGVRESSSAVYDTSHNRMIVFGGEEAIISCCPNIRSAYNDVWVLSSANGHGGTPVWTRLQPDGNPPAPRYDHSAVYDPTGNNMYVFGGRWWSNSNQIDTVLGDVWKLSNANGLGTTTPQWTQIGQLGTPPGGNLEHGAAFDRVNRRMMSFGGYDRNFVPHFLTFMLDLKQH